MLITEKGSVILGVLQKGGHDSVDNAISAKDIAIGAFMIPGGVPGVLTGLFKKGLVDKTDESPRNYFLTEAGKNFDLD